MTWRNHKLVSIAIAYAIGLPLEEIIIKFFSAFDFRFSIKSLIKNFN